MNIQEEVKKRIDAIQQQIKHDTWIETRGNYDERCYFMTQDTQKAAKNIALENAKKEAAVAKDCFVRYSDLQRWEETTLFKEYNELIAALEAFEPQSDEIK